MGPPKLSGKRPVFRCVLVTCMSCPSAGKKVFIEWLTSMDDRPRQAVEQFPIDSHLHPFA